MTKAYWIETLGCPKNDVDSAKLVGTLAADGYVAAESPDEADLVVVNTCAFIDEARQESVDTVLDLSGRRRPDAELVVIPGAGHVVNLAARTEFNAVVGDFLDRLPSA